MANPDNTATEAEPIVPLLPGAKGRVLFALDHNSRFVDASPAALQLVGYSLEELQELTASDLVMPGFEEFLQNGQSPKWEGGAVNIELRHKENHAVPVTLDVSLLRIGPLSATLWILYISAGQHLLHQFSKFRLDLLVYAKSHTLDDVLTRSLDDISAMVESPIGFYHLLDDDETTIVLQQWSTRTIQDYCTLDAKGMHYHIDEAGVWVEAVRARRPVIHNDYESLPNTVGLPEGHVHIQRELVVPIIRQECIVALLGVGNKSRDYTHRDIEIVSYMADITWEIVEAKRSQESEARMNRARRILSRINLALIQSQSEQALLDSACQILVETGGYPMVWVGKAESDAAKQVRPIAQWGEGVGDYLDKIRISWADDEYGQGPTGTAIRTGVPNFVQEMASDPRFRSWRERAAKRNVNSSVALPLRGNGQVWGALNIYATKIDAFDADEIGMLAELTADIGFGLDSLRVREERDRAKVSLLVSEERFRVMAETSSDLIFQLDLEGRILYASSAVERILGYAPEDVLGRLLADYLPAAQLGPTLADFASIIAEQHTMVVTGDVITKSGLIVVAEATLVPMMAGQRIVGIQGSLRDITERRKAEDALRRLTQAIEQSPVSVLITDSQGVIEYVSPAFTHISGYTAEEAIGRTPRFLKSGLHPPEFYREMWQTILSGKFWQGEVCNRRKDGQPYWLLSSISAVRNQTGQITHFVSVREDITERKRTEEEHARQERLASVGQLAAGIAHDFNNVLATIVLYIQLMDRSGELSPRNQERVNVIQKQATHASGLIQQILDFSRRGALDQRPLDLLSLVEEQISLLQHTLSETVQVELHHDKGDFAVSADPTRIQQVLTNLAINARDAMPDGGRLDITLDRLRVISRKSAPIPNLPPGEWVRLSIADTGTGIPDSVLPHVFDPFFTTKAAGKGNGLGLSQVHGIVAQHGGRVHIETKAGKEPDRGTRFSIYLPALTIVQDDIRSEPDRADEERMGQNNVILVVEDKPVLREVMVDTLESWNYQVITAANGVEALAVMAKHGRQVDLVLSDVVMPEMGGVALFHALLKEGWKVPVILVSGHPKDQQTEKMMEMGLAGFLTKPVSADLLAKSIASAL